MKVIEYLKTHTLAELSAEFGIKVKEYPEEGVVVLNYCQIESPKTHPIVMECRGLILDTEALKVICRPFDRFFNYGEAPETQEGLQMNRGYVCAKVDGSLIKIYHHKGKWHIATRGTAFAESQVNGFDLTFKDLVLKALNVTEQEFQDKANRNLYQGVTYLCEVTAMENRVVTCYPGYTLWFLAARDNSDGTYLHDCIVDIVPVGAKPIPKYAFASMEACVKAAAELPDLQEGYVYYQDGVPMCKIKSPAYVAVHHLRGEGLNPKRIAQLVLTGETEEYLKYFPEDREHIEPYQKALISLKVAVGQTYDDYFDVESQKDFAMMVKDYSFSSILFTARKQKISTVEAFEKQTDNYKLQLLLEWV